VTPSATAGQISAAYKRKARLVHPDRHQGADAAVIAQAERAMRAINEAWEVLGDPVRRRIYDESLRPARAAPSPTAPSRPRRIVPAPPIRSRRGWVVAATCLVVVVVGWAFLGRGGGDPRSVAVPLPTTVPPTVGASSGGGAPIVFHDEQAGFTITYPRSWRELTPTAPDMRLSVEAGDNDGLELRITPIASVASSTNIGSFKAMTDALVYVNPTVKLQRVQQVTLNGRLTYYYVTTYQDRSGQEGIHEQYFIFEGLRMFSLRFQSFPASEYADQSTLYSQVADSFTVTRG
jgi:hypothetical protein